LAFGSFSAPVAGIAKILDFAFLTFSLIASVMGLKGARRRRR
jgi:uncharacterized membrane protein YtjA (UPF0391 family)